MTVALVFGSRGLYKLSTLSMLLRMLSRSFIYINTSNDQFSRLMFPPIVFLSTSFTDTGM